jgi:hypothetical protein
MGLYNGDQIANNPTVVANYLRTVPTTRLSTRQLQFFEVSVTGASTDPTLSNSVFSKAVRGIQAQAEVIAIGSPNGSNFMIVVSADTANDGNNSDALENYSNALARTLQDSVQASTGLSATVAYKVMYGNSFSSAYGGRAETMPNTEGTGEPSYGNEWNNGD